MELILAASIVAGVATIRTVKVGVETVEAAAAVSVEEREEGNFNLYPCIFQ